MKAGLGIALVVAREGNIVWSSSVFRGLVGQVEVIGRPVSQFLMEKSGQWFLKTERGWEAVICSYEAARDYEAFLVIPVSDLPSTEEENITDRDNFLKHFGRVLLAHRFEEGYIALILIDIVNFKRFRVLYSEELAERIITTLFLRVKETFRKGDIVARVASDDLAVVVKVKTLEDLNTVAKRVLDVVRAPVAVQEKPILPDVESRSILSGTNSPFWIAVSMIRFAALSFTEPLGLNHSALA